ncbi:mechanosensitive ion channel family protein [Methylomicrobium sp. Wu6]|uniref:mechanosensitive ion channel family protein n=1 Tax=Methylomicrobium sp. Wu6 TaxID=3107928 RepID=UPI002DD65582|nr:mechanosensitive ion channel family protein [Methylomicrobium sp. Wu6]MEC4748117.1 mechanosensitive ion channel family protein [Methylomicrobium sp. Wu6]
MKVRLLLWLGFVWLVLGNMTVAGETKTVASAPAAVELDGETLFQVRGFKNIPAQFRADKIAERIKRLAEDPYLSTDSIKLVSDELSTDVMAGDTIVVMVLEYDAVTEGVSRQERAAHLADIIRTAIVKYREAHSIRSLIHGVLFALIATALLAAFIYALFWLFHRIELALDSGVHRKLAATHIRIFEFIIGGVLAGAVRLLRFLFLVAILYVYFSIILSFFPWTRTFAEQLFSYIAYPIKQIGKDIWIGLPNLIFLLILIIVVRWLLGILRFFLKAVEKGDIEFAGFYAEWAAPTYKICRFLIVIFAIAVAYPYIPGSKSRAFEGISIFLGVLFSLGSTSLIANMVAGVVLTYMRGFRVGDVVRIGDTTGKVTAVALLVTRLRTIKNVEITIPNSLLMTSQVINYSFAAGEGRLILPVSITIGYDAPWRQVHGLLLLAAERTGQVLCEPAPFVLQSALDDFYVKYELNVYADSSDDMPRIYSDLHQNIQDAFNEYGVQIMSPHYVADPDAAKVVPRERWSQPPA